MVHRMNYGAYGVYGASREFFKTFYRESKKCDKNLVRNFEFV